MSPGVQVMEQAGCDSTLLTSSPGTFVGDNAQAAGWVAQMGSASKVHHWERY
jgi:hypothetical protein